MLASCASSPSESSTDHPSLGFPAATATRKALSDDDRVGMVILDIVLSCYVMLFLALKTVLAVLPGGEVGKTLNQAGIGDGQR